MGLGTIVGLLGTAASLAGTGASISASADANAQQTKRVQEQINQQQELQKKNVAVLGKNVEASTPTNVNKGISQGEAQAKELYNKVNAVPLNSGTAAATMGARDLAIGQSSQKGYQDVLGDPAAFLQGLGTQQVNQNIGNALTNSQLGVTNFLSGMSASSLPYLLQAAQNRGSEGQAIGSLLGSLGGLASTGAASYGGFSRSGSQNTPQIGLGYGAQGYPKNW